MEQFIARENVRRFKRQLENCTDEDQRATLEKLLAEYAQHLAAIEGQVVTTKPSRGAQSG